MILYNFETGQIECSLCGEAQPILMELLTFRFIIREFLERHDHREDECAL